MFQRILVPLDGSACAAQALPVAIRIAKASGEQGAIILVRAVNPMNEYWSISTAVPEPTMPQATIDAEISEASRYLADLAKSNDFEGVNIETVVLYGSVASTILETVTEHKADIIVMCSHGYTGMKRWVIGSVAEKIARHAPVPVFILREGETMASEYTATRPIRTLVPLDGSAYAKSALVPAAYLTAALAGNTQGELHLTRVVAPMDEPENMVEEQKIVRKASKYLSTTVEHIYEGLVAAPMNALNVTLGWSVLEDADAASAIVREAERGEETGTGNTPSYDMVVIATHGRGGLQRWAMGSVTERVLKTTRLPVLIVRPLELVRTSEAVWQKAMTTV